MLYYILTLFVCMGVSAVNTYAFTFRPVNENGNEGYVEMNINGSWGIMSVPFTPLNDYTARLLCQTFGFGSTGFSTNSPVSLDLSQNAILWYYIIRCNGTESIASRCARNLPTGGPWESTLPRGWTRLHCFDFNVTDIRLYGGDVPNEGRLEVKVGDSWGAVCRHGYDSPINTDTVCSMLGYVKDSYYIPHPNFADNIEPGEDFWMSTLQCENTNNNINQCNFVTGGLSYCHNDYSRHVVTLKCEPAQLINGTSPNAGIVEVGLFGKRQMVCGASSFYTEEANVTCNALGYQSVGHISTVEPSPDNTGLVFNGLIQCDGTELSLETCDIVQEQSACPVSTVMYIECLGGPIDIIPIGNKSNEGVFTMYGWNQLWIVGSRGSSFSNVTAKTLCYLLGHGYEGSSHYLANLPVNVSLPEYTSLERLDCQGNETDIAQCQRTFFYPCTRCPIGYPSGFILLYCNECPPGYFGTHCTECNCNNRSTIPCDVHTGECTCVAGWSGASCETDIDECETTTCYNNSVCTNIPGSYLCECRLGYTLTNGVCAVRNEEQTVQTSNLLVIVLSSVIGGLSLVSIIAIFCLCKYRKTGKKSKSDTADASITYRSGNEFNVSSTNKSDDYSAIDDRFLQTGPELTSVEARTDPYDTIDGTVKTNDRPEIPTRPDLKQMKMDNKDPTEISSTQEYDYTYPSVLPTEDGYLKLDGASPRVVPTDEDGYLKADNASPRNADGDSYIQGWFPQDTSSRVIPTDDDGYLRTDVVDRIQTEGRNKTPDNDTNNDYRRLNPRNQSEHEYEHMKH